MKTSNTSTITRQACEWVAKLHESELSESEHNEFKTWVAQSEKHQTEIRRIAEQWEQLNDLTALAVPTSSSPVTATNEHKTGYFSFTKGFSFAKGFTAVTAVAAVAVLAIGLWPQASTKQELTQKFEQKVPSYTTVIGEQRFITLPDTSTVLLNTDSQFSIAYTPEFRDIYLIQGEAHFEVQQSSERPFRVFAGKSQVRAVGTAFSVHLKKKTVCLLYTSPSPRD